jgi:hypothetical protein
MGSEEDRHKWGYDRTSLCRFLSEWPWEWVDVFDWRSIDGARIAKDFWIAGMECVK